MLASWAAADSRAFRRLLFVLAVVLWAVPGPVLGFGLKAAIERLMDLEDLVLAWTSARPVRAVLYDLPTPVPVLWRTWPGCSRTRSRSSGRRSGTCRGTCGRRPAWTGPARGASSAGSSGRPPAGRSGWPPWQ